MMPQTTNNQNTGQFERSPESFPKTIIFPEAWDLSEILQNAPHPDAAIQPGTAFGKLDETPSNPV